MLHNQKIIFVSVVDNNSNTFEDFSTRTFHHERLISDLFQTENCLVGRKTFEILQRKGPKSWVLTSDHKWKREGIGTIYSLDDLHLFNEGPIYIIGSNTIQIQLKDFVDEIHLYVINNSKGTGDWIKLNMRDWKPIMYISKGVWSYAHLEKSINHDIHDFNESELFI